MIRGHGGNVYDLARRLGCAPEEILDLSSNINPLGMPPGLLDHLRGRLGVIGVLPEADGRSAARHMAALLGLSADRILAGNGTTQFIYSVCPALGARQVLIVGPTYADYADACRMHRIEPRYFLTRVQNQFDIDWTELDQALADMDVAFVCNPNNPTGRLIPHDLLLALCQAQPRTHFVIDESYLPFVPTSHAQSMAGCELPNVSVMHSISKIFGVPGLRAGFLIANPAIVARFIDFMQPWILNSLAQEALAWLYRNHAQVEAFVAETHGYLETERGTFRQALASGAQMMVYPSLTSYLLVGLPDSWRADEVCALMAQERLLIRNCSNFYGLSDRFIRVALKHTDLNRLAARRLVEICA